MFPGDILRNRYKITKLLGSGNFGITYLAEDLDLPDNPLCVVKNLRQSQNPQELKDFIAFFDKEAKALSRLGNECNQIPRLFAHFQEGDEFYLVQEYVDGHDLSEEIFPENKLSEAQVTQLLIDILEVLAFVHNNNIIHRDIKAQNLMRRHSDGKIVLIDFGTVKEINKLKANSEYLTNASVIVGTPGYMPTEQLIGYPRLCSDVYAVGMLGIYALTGTKPKDLPKDPDTFEVIWQDKVSVSPQLANVLDKMVCSNSKERYQTAGEVLQELQIPSSEPTTPTISLAPGQYRVSSPASFPGLNQRFFISFGVVFSLVFGMVFVFPFFSQKLKVNAQICLAMVDLIPIKTQKPDFQDENFNLYILAGGKKANQKFHGCGTKVDREEGDKYQGIFRNNLLNGRGILKFKKSGDRYQGEFQQDEPLGQGTYIYKESRNKYVGKYKNGLRNGSGKFIYKNGCRFEGIFENTFPHGKASCISKNGTKDLIVDKKQQLDLDELTCCDSISQN